MTALRQFFRAAVVSAALFGPATAQEEDPFDYRLSVATYETSDSAYNDDAFRAAIEEIGPGGYARIAYTFHFRPGDPLYAYDNAGVFHPYTHCGVGPPPSGALTLSAIRAPYRDDHGATSIYLSPADGRSRASCFEAGDAFVSAEYGFVLTVTGCFRLERRWVPTLELIDFAPADPAMCDG